MSTLPSDEANSEGSQIERIAIAIVIDRGRVLLGRRPLGVSMAGYSEFPGGKIEGDETIAEATRRECLEETGVTVTVGESVSVVRHAINDGQDLRELHFHQCTPLGSHIASPPFEWVPLSRLDSYKFPPANAEVLRVLKRMSESL